MRLNGYEEYQKRGGKAIPEGMVSITQSQTLSLSGFAKYFEGKKGAKLFYDASNGKPKSIALKPIDDEKEGFKITFTSTNTAWIYLKSFVVEHNIEIGHYPAKWNEELNILIVNLGD